MEKPQLDSVVCLSLNEEDIYTNLNGETSTEYTLLRRKQRMSVVASYPSFVLKGKYPHASQLTVDELTDGLRGQESLSKNSDLTYFLFPEGVSLVAGKQPGKTVHTFVATTLKGVLYGCCLTKYAMTSDKQKSAFKLQVATAIIQEQEAMIVDQSDSVASLLSTQAHVEDVYQPECLCLLSPFPIHAFQYEFMKIQPDQDFPTLTAHLARLTTLQLQPHISCILLSTVWNHASPKLSLWSLLAAPLTVSNHTRTISMFIPLNPYSNPSKPVSPLETVLIVQHQLSERSVMVLSMDKQLITSTCMSILAFLLPLQWEFVFIPLLAVDQVEPQLHSPVPFLIGSLLPYISPQQILQERSNILVVDLDASPPHRFHIRTTSNKQGNLIDLYKIWLTNNNVRNIATGKLFPSSQSGPLIPILPSITRNKQSFEISTQEAQPHKNDLDDFLMHVMRPVKVLRNELPEPADLHEQLDQGMLLTDDTDIERPQDIKLKQVYSALLHQLPQRATLTSTASYSMQWCSSSVQKLSLPPFLSDNYIYIPSKHTVSESLYAAFTNDIVENNAQAYVQQQLQSSMKQRMLESTLHEHNKGTNYSAMSPALSYQLENNNLTGLLTVLHGGKMPLPDLRLRASILCWNMVLQEIRPIPVYYTHTKTNSLQVQIEHILHAQKHQGQAQHSLLGPSVFESLGVMQTCLETYLHTLFPNIYTNNQLKKHLQWTSRRCFVLSTTLIALGHHIASTLLYIYNLVIDGDTLMQQWGSVSQDAQWQEVTLRGVANQQETQKFEELLSLQEQPRNQPSPPIVLENDLIHEGATHVKQIYVKEGDFEICSYAVNIRECILYLLTFCIHQDDIIAYLDARNACLEQHIILLQEIVNRLKNKNDDILHVQTLLPRKVPYIQQPSPLPAYVPFVGPDPFHLGECYTSTSIIYSELLSVQQQGRSEYNQKLQYAKYTWQCGLFPTFVPTDTNIDRNGTIGDSAWSFAPWSSCIVVTAQITAKALATLYRVERDKVDCSSTYNTNHNTKDHINNIFTLDNEEDNDILNTLLGDHINDVYDIRDKDENHNLISSNNNDDDDRKSISSTLASISTTGSSVSTVDEELDISLVPKSDNTHLHLHQLLMNISTSLVVSKEVQHRAYRLQHGYQCLFEMLLQNSTHNNNNNNTADDSHQITTIQELLSATNSFQSKHSTNRSRRSSQSMNTSVNNSTNSSTYTSTSNSLNNATNHIISQSTIASEDEILSSKTSNLLPNPIYTQLYMDNENIDPNSPFHHVTLDLPYDLTLDLPESDQEEQDTVIKNRFQYAQHTVEKAGKQGFFHSPRMQYTPQQHISTTQVRYTTKNSRRKYKKKNFFQNSDHTNKSNSNTNNTPSHIPHIDSLDSNHSNSSSTSNNGSENTAELGLWVKSMLDKEILSSGTIIPQMTTQLEESTIVCIESTLTEMNLSNFEPSTRECIYCLQDTAYVLVRRVKSGQLEQQRASSIHDQAVLRVEQGALQGSQRFLQHILKGSALAALWFSSSPLWFASSQAWQGIRHMASVRRVSSNNEAQAVVLAITELELRKQWSQTLLWTSTSIKKNKTFLGNKWVPAILQVSPACIKYTPITLKTKHVYVQLRRAQRAQCELQQAAQQFCNDCKRCGIKAPIAPECICTSMHVVLKTGALPVYSHKLQRLLIIHTLLDVEGAEKLPPQSPTPYSSHAFYYGCKHTLPLLQSALQVAGVVSMLYIQFEATLQMTNYYTRNSESVLHTNVPYTPVTSVFRKDGPYDSPYTLNLWKENTPTINTKATSTEVLDKLNKRKLDLHPPEFANHDNMLYSRLHREPQEQALYGVNIGKMNTNILKKNPPRKKPTLPGLPLCFQTDLHRQVVATTLTAHKHALQNNLLQAQNYTPIVNTIQFLFLDSLLLDGIDLLECIVGTDQTPTDPQYQVYLPLKSTYAWNIKHEGYPKHVHTLSLSSGSINDKMQCEKRLPMLEQLSTSAAVPNLYNTHMNRVCLDQLNIRNNMDITINNSISECLENIPWYFCE